MLVVSRRVSQTLEVGADIRVTVLGIRSDQVRLGVVAPREISVVRSELLEQVKLFNHASAQLDPSELMGQFTKSTPASITMVLPVHDLEASLKFYQALGFQRLQGHGQATSAQLRRGSVVLTLKVGQPCPPLAICLMEDLDAPCWLTDPNGYRISI